MSDVTLTVSVDERSTNRFEARQLSCQFGDGYSQDAPDGINNVVEIWEITTPPMTHTAMNTLVASLVSAQSTGVRLAWTAPTTGAAAKRWRVPEKWDRRWLSYNVETLTFTLREAF